MIDAFEGVVKNAIIAEENAHDFYIKLTETANTTSVKALFERLAKEELKHKKLLENINMEQDINIDPANYDKLNIVEDLLLTPLSEFKSLKDAFEIAIRQEELAFEGYNKTAKALPSGKIRNLFEMLANEELKHKDLISSEYYKALGKK